MKRLIGGAGLAVLMASGVCGQTAQAPRAFEVAPVEVLVVDHMEKPSAN
jgi:hypothetical protein